MESVTPPSVREIPTTKKPTRKVKPDPFCTEVARTEPLALTQHQQEAYDKIIAHVKREASSVERSGVFLLHGVTGSGKTEIYLQVMAKVRESGRQTIVLVPEIALTPQTVHRFRERFGDSVAVLHSHLTAKQRLIQWQRIRNGEASVVIGARSAIFAPFKNLGLIIIDEEHETSFKNISTPFYHARETAIERARLENAIVILGSATPSLESYYNSVHPHTNPDNKTSYYKAEKESEGRKIYYNDSDRIGVGVYQRLVLPERIDHRPMPKVEVIDILQEGDSKHPVGVLSRKLELGIRDEVLKGNQVILFLNRRGFLTLMKCSRCGHIVRCHRCQVSLAYHKQFNKAVCHYCNEKTDLPAVCPECRHPNIKLFGTGTEKVEEYLNKFWESLNYNRKPSMDASAETLSLDGRGQGEGDGAPSLTIGRMDSDSMKKKGLYKDALHSFFTGETDVLVGTQMIAKGLDFPNVTLVGIVSADTALYLKDFRSAERTFQLITQVAGRTGRGPKGGRVIVQTVNPKHYSILAGSNHDYEGFARQELLYRRELNYPPFRHIIRILVSGKSQEGIHPHTNGIGQRVSSYTNDISTEGKPSHQCIGVGVKQVIDKIAQQINTELKSMIDTGDIEVLGPAPAPILRIRDRFRWHLVLKIKDLSSVQKYFKEMFKMPFVKGGVQVSIDTDPVSLL